GFMYHKVEPEDLPVFTETVGGVTTRYEYDGILQTLTPLVDGYEQDHGAAVPSVTDPVGAGWTEEASGVTFSGGGNQYSIYQQPGGDLYAFSVYVQDQGTANETTHYTIAYKVDEEEQPDTANQLTSGNFDLTNYTQVSGGLGYLGVQDFAGTDAITVDVYYDENAVVGATPDVSATKTITVIEVNDPPTVSAAVDLGNVDEDTPVKIYASDLIANTTDEQTVTVVGNPSLVHSGQG
ncbi:uncharacterized protein METZ01_LOCUS496103, partial [marine metagenome]